MINDPYLHMATKFILHILVGMSHIKIDILNEYLQVI